MNENLPQQMPAIKDWINDATRQLKAAGIPTPRLDAEIILAHTIRRSRTYLHAHDDEALSDRADEIASARVLLRCDRTPVAYIIGHKEFYGRRFKVTPSTLIPRPESETMITLLKELLPHSVSLLSATTLRLVDVGTGSGCLGITAKLEVPELDVTLCDISNHALAVAKTNARVLEADVATLRSDLLSQYPFTPNIILANLPYVDINWERSPETNFEPEEALFAGDQGLAVIKRLIESAALRLPPNGLVFFEADPRQHETIARTAKSHGLVLREHRDFIVVFEKI